MFTLLLIAWCVFALASTLQGEGDEEKPEGQPAPPDLGAEGEPATPEAPAAPAPERPEAEAAEPAPPPAEPAEPEAEEAPPLALPVVVPAALPAPAAEEEAPPEEAVVPEAEEAAPAAAEEEVLVPAEEAAVEAEEEAVDRAAWYRSSILNIHFDYHVSADQADVGAGADANVIAGLLESPAPTAVQYHAKGHPGYATYPTQVGQPAPHLARDVLAAWREIADRRKAKLLFYYSSGVDSAQAELHPEWRRRGADGQPVEEGWLKPLCYNTAYVDEIVLPQLRELIERYHPDGFWFDGDNWSVRLCYCDRCRTLFREQYGAELPAGLDSPHWPEFCAFERRSFVRYLERCARLIHELNPQCMFCSNWAFTVRQPEPPPRFIDWLSGDVPLAHGAVTASLEARFLVHQGKPFDIMICDWIHQPDYLKTAAHLEQEAGVILANGGRVFVWDNPRTNGAINAAAMARVGEVAEWVREREPWCHDAEPDTEIAVLHGASTHYARGGGLFDYGAVVDPVRGAHQLLVERHFSVDVVTETYLLSHLDRYRTIVLAEQRDLPAEFVPALRTYVEHGGTVIATGLTSAGDSGQLALGELLGVELEGPGEGELYLARDGQGVPVPGPWQRFRTTRATVVQRAADRDGHVSENAPPLVALNALGKGQTLYLAADLFGAYHRTQYPDLGASLAEIVERIHPKRIQTDLPAWVEVTLWRRGIDLVVHLANRGTGRDLRDPNWPHVWVSDVPSLGPHLLDLACSREPQSVMLQPDDKPAKYTWKNGRLKIRLPDLDIHRLVVIREERTAE